MSYGTPPPPPVYGVPMPGGVPPNHPRAVLILVFGILGLVCCGPFGIAAWVMGNTALREIDAAPAAYQGRGMVAAGRICGIIATILMVVGVIGYALLFGIGLATNS